MTIVGGIIQIVLILLPAVLAAWSRSHTQQAMLDELNEKSDKAVASGDADTISIIVDDSLQRLRDADSGVKQ